MRVKVILGLIVVMAVMVSPPLLSAQDHKTPTAPKEYLDMKNPFERDKGAIERGEGIYMKKCKKCHGENGDGKGSAAKDLEIKPRAFTKDYISQRPPGQFFWIIEKGSPNTDMEALGPGTDTNLSRDDIWKLVTFIRERFGK